MQRSIRLNRRDSLTNLVWIGALATAWLAIPAVAAGDTPSMAQFIKMRWPSSGTLTVDGSFYYVHNPDGLYQLYRRMPDSTQAKKLTDFPDGMSGYRTAPDGKWIVVAAAAGGSEQDDLHLLDTSTNQLAPLFVDSETVFGSVLWKRDSSGFAYRANKENKSDFNVYIHDLATGKSRRVMDRAGYYYPVDFNATGDKLVVGKYNSASHSQLFEIDLHDLATREITPADEAWSFDGAGYTPDEKHFLAVTNYRGDLSNLRTIDLASGAIAPFAPELDRYEIDGAGFNHERDVLAILANEDGYRTLHLRAMPENQPLPTPKMGKGLVGNVNFCKADMLFSLTNANTPGIIYRWSRKTPDQAPVPLTEADTQGIDVSKFALPKLIKYKSFDGLEVPAFLYTPPGHTPGTPIPFIVSYHGGPEGQYRPGFSRSFQYFLTRGFGVLAPNVRGSSGYGKKYLEMDNYKLRMDSVMDGVWAARWLVKNKYSEAGKIAAFGGSYGGFMVVATITQAPNLFGAACDVVGIVNFKTFLERTKAYRRKLREAEYGPLTDPEFLESISPIHLAHRIETPLLIAHGKNDPRVPVYEAEQMYAKLKELGRPVEKLIFEDEGHGFRKEANRIEFYETLADFFEKHLTGQKAAPGSAPAATQSN
jgi:dipeptidyl aminopeptidase/acylaminoacyl peptidase